MYDINVLRFPFGGAAGGSKANSHEFPFFIDIEFCTPSLTGTLVLKLAEEILRMLRHFQTKAYTIIKDCLSSKLGKSTAPSY